MSNDEEKIRKIEKSESEILAIYSDIYPSLMNISAPDFPSEVLAELNKLDPPEMISPEKAAAVLKAILGSTSEDKFRLEYFYPLELKDGSHLGSYVKDRLLEIGISYADFWPYLKERGQLN